LTLLLTPWAVVDETVAIVAADGAAETETTAAIHAAFATDGASTGMRVVLFKDAVTIPRKLNFEDL
jgi:hypothetical protein